MKVVVTGAPGILGSALLHSQLFADAVGTVRTHASTHRTVRIDLRDREATRRTLDEAAPDVVLHTVGLTDVDCCERDPAAAFEGNVLTTLNVADWIHSRSPDTLLLYVSSDQVYSGSGPHAEDRVLPVNVYGLTKHAGELAAVRSPRHLIVRTNFYGKSRGWRPSFTDWILAAASEGREIALNAEATFSALHLDHLVALLAACIDRGVEGVYNCGTHDAIRKFDFARLFLRGVFPDAADLVVPLPEAAGHERARRPLDLGLDVSRLEAALGHDLPTVAESLERLCEESRDAVRA